MADETWIIPVLNAIARAQGGGYVDSTVARAAYDALKGLGLIIPTGCIAICAACGQPLECVPNNCKGYDNLDDYDAEEDEKIPCPVIMELIRQ